MRHLSSAAIFVYVVFVLFVSCSRTKHQQVTSFRLEADTIRQGGLELLHNISIVNNEGNVLFTDSTRDYEPNHFSVIVPDSTHPESCYLMLMVFDPCEDQTLVLRSDGHSIQSLGVFLTDSIPHP